MSMCNCIIALDVCEWMFMGMSWTHEYSLSMDFLANNRDFTKANNANKAVQAHMYGLISNQCVDYTLSAYKPKSDSVDNNSGIDQHCSNSNKILQVLELTKKAKKNEGHV